MSGRFIAVVGPSGVGKDCLMDALCARRPDLLRTRRVITRAPEPGGENHVCVSPSEFEARVRNGEFALHWQAHDLHYGIPKSVMQALKGGQDVLANLSRGMLTAADRAFEDLRVLHVTARPEVLAQRLQARGRESAAEIAERLSRPAPALPQGLKIIELDNSGPLEQTVQAACDALYPVNA